MPRRFIRRENWEFGGAAPGSEETKEPRSRKRRLASTLVFTTIFFAGASLAAVAGDQLKPLVANDSQELAADTTTTTEADVRRRPRTPQRPQPPRRTSPRPRTQRHLPMRPQRRRTRPQPRPTPQTLRRRTMRCHRSMPRVPRVLQPRLSRRPSRTRTHRSRPERRRVPGRRPSCAHCSCRS